MTTIESRREFIKKTALIIAGTGLSLNLISCSDDAIEPKTIFDLPIPKLLKGTSFDLNAQNGSHDFGIGEEGPTLGYNGSILGPTLLLTKGDDVSITVSNSLTETTTCHFHGLHIPAKMDGGPHQMIPVGESWTSSFKVLNQAGTSWYHPHHEGKTATQVYGGLAGFIIIEDPTNKPALPSTYGVDDIPIVIQDRTFNSDGSLSYSGERRGVKGFNLTVNGAITPKFAAPAQMVRFRILNGSNARMYNIGFSDNRTFYQVATDGGYLESKVALTRLELANGERAEIIVDFSGQKSESVNMVSYSEELSYLNNNMASDDLDDSTFDIFTINIGDKNSSSITSIPGNLATINRISESSAVKTRKFNLQMGGGSFTINGKSMSMERIDETVKLGDTEIWEISNSSEMPHPFHIHDMQFLILTINGFAPADNLKGWKDTVLVKQGETVRFITTFTDFADDTHPYMYHCHILEHEDAGMMGQFLVVN